MVRNLNFVYMYMNEPKGDAMPRYMDHAQVTAENGRIRIWFQTNENVPHVVKIDHKGNWTISTAADNWKEHTGSPRVRKLNMDGAIFNFPLEQSSLMGQATLERSDRPWYGEMGYDIGRICEFSMVEPFGSGMVNVEVYVPDNERRNQIEVIYDGAVDFTGNRRDFRKRYPELYNLIF